LHFKRIVTEGLAHFSYLVGDGGKAVVIDPRRDCDVYLEEAHRAGLEIMYVLETHRHEDMVLGSAGLARRAGAEVWHADDELPYQYGQPLRESQIFQIGQLRLEAIPSPGHTPGGMSYLLREASGIPWMLFSGDTWLAGDVGRVDLLGEDRMFEMARLLHDTLFERLIPLGDQTLLWPAHGAGTVCGRAVADRPWTTLGLERRLNPLLRLHDRAAFVASVAVGLGVPPYFARVETLNLEGKAPPSNPAPLIPARAFAEMAADCQVIDLRSYLEYQAGHIRSTLYVGPYGIAPHGGWLLDADKPILLVTGPELSAEAARAQLARVGFDQVTGSLAEGFTAWVNRGLPIAQTRSLTVGSLCSMIERGVSPYILDVREGEEAERDGSIPGSQRIELHQLPQRLDELERGIPITVICRTGERSSIGAGLLEKAGWDDLAVLVGGISAWRSADCALPISWSDPATSDLGEDG